MIFDFNEGIKYLNTRDRKSDESIFSNYDTVLINLNEPLIRSLKAFYYLEVIHDMYKQDKIRIYVIKERGADIPKRLQWLADLAQ